MVQMLLLLVLVFMCNSPFSFLSDKESTTILCKRQILKWKVFLQVTKLSLVRYLKYLLDYPFLYDFKFIDNWTLDSIGLLTHTMQNEKNQNHYLYTKCQ